MAVVLVTEVLEVSHVLRLELVGPPAADNASGNADEEAIC